MQLRLETGPGPFTRDIAAVAGAMVSVICAMVSGHRQHPQPNESTHSSQVTGAAAQQVLALRRADLNLQLNHTSPNLRSLGLGEEATVRFANLYAGHAPSW